MKKLLLGLMILFAFSAFAQDPSLPIDMEDPADDAWVANGVDYSLETVLFSPNQVGKIVDQGTVQYDSRVDLSLGTYIDMETPSKTFTFEFYTTTTDVMTGLFQISNEASAGYPIEMTFTTDGAIGWQTITLDFTNADNGYPWCQTCPNPQPVVYGQYARVTIFTNFGSFTTGTYYFDDIDGAANGAVVGADPAPASPPIPQPTAAAEDVISVFSDVYTDLATGWHPAWSQSTVYSDEIIVGTSPEDHISKLKYFSYDAVLLEGASNPTNVESMEYVHFDIWSHDETSIWLFLLTGPEPAVSKTLVPGQWNSFDIPLTDFTGAVLSDLWGIKFESGTYTWPNGTSLVYLDNIYFWKTAGAGTLTFDPQNGATNVAVDIDPSLSFSIPVAMANDDPITNGDIPSIITFKETDASGADVPFTGTINPGEDVITVIPTTDLDLNQAYYMALNNEVIKYQGGPLIAEQSVTFTTVSTPLALPVTFEDSQVNYGLVDFGGTASNIIADPSNPFNSVVETIKNALAADWAGTTVGEPTGLTPAVPFAPGYTRLSMRVYSPAVDVPVLFKLEVWDNTAVAVETISYTTVANEWETLVFDFSNENAGTDPLDFANAYNKPVTFFNFGVIGGGETYYWDDIEFINEFLETVSFEPVSGSVQVPVTVNPSITFSLPVTMADGSAITNADIPSIITLKKTDASGTDVPFTGTIDVAKEVITVIPTTDLNLNQDYYLALNNNVIRYQGSDLIVEQSITFSTVSAPFTLPITFDDIQVNYGLSDFGGNVSSITVHPSNPFNAVVESSNGAETWAGSSLAGPNGTGLDDPLPFAPGSTQMSVRVWSPTAGVPVRFKVENGSNDAISVETEVLTTVASAWEILTFDFSNEVPGTPAINFAESYHKPVVFFDFGIAGAGELYYWDDIEFIDGLQVDLTVFLEGPYSPIAETGNMLTDLNSGGYLPTSQPYNPGTPYYGNDTPVWLYAGTETADPIPSVNVVDWVLVQLRDADAPANATSATILSTQPALLLNDGKVVGLDGSSMLRFDVTVSQNMYAVIYHKNHLGILSNNALTDGGDGIYSYDFSSGESQVYGGASGHKDLGDGVWGMIAADGDADGNVLPADETNVWVVDVNGSGYLGGDYDLNGLGQPADKTGFWIPNSNKSGQIPGAKGEFTKGYQSQIPE